jgi:signal transduction histidine kinase
VEEVVALTAGAAASRHVAVHAFVPADLPPVSADRVELLQVLLNLVVNGMDAMSPVEERERLLEIHARPEGDERVAVSVRDRGVGLTAAQMPRLFEAFYTTKTYGMGMGLAISRSIIESHGGRLWAEPNQGRGATFAFSLPAVSLARDGAAP